MSSVNKVILIGRLGRDPEVKFTQSGSAVCNFSMATDESWKDKSGEKQSKTEWHNIVVWGKLAEICGQYLTKGKQVYVSGRIQTREWDDKDGNKRKTTEIVASEMTMLGDKGGKDSEGAAPRTSAASKPAETDFGIKSDFPDDDSVPF